MTDPTIRTRVYKVVAEVLGCRPEAVNSDPMNLKYMVKSDDDYKRLEKALGKEFSSSMVSEGSLRRDDEHATIGGIIKSIQQTESQKDKDGNLTGGRYMGETFGGGSL
ncbi:hypothetical protein ACWD6P_00045 [Streptomyces sp. NPDC002446]